MKLCKGAMLIVVLMGLAFVMIACGDSGVQESDGDGADGDIGDGDLDDLIPCDTDFDCPPSLFCIDQYCLPTPPENCDSICTSNDDCPEGHICNYSANCQGKVCHGPDPDGDEVDGDITVPPKSPRISINPSELNFGAVSVMERSERAFEITNDSNFNIELRIDAIHYDNILQTSEFSFAEPEDETEEPWSFPIFLSRGQSLVVKMVYVPIDSGIDEAEVTVVSNDIDNPITRVSLFSQYKGTAYISSVPDCWDFGNLDLGSEPMFKDFTIQNVGENSGNKVLTIYEIKMASGHNPHFSIISGMVTPFEPIQLTPTETHVFTVQYLPQMPADDFSPHRDRILIVNNSEDVTQRAWEVCLEGTAESSLLSVFPMPMDFGETTIKNADHPDEPCETDDDCPLYQTCMAEFEGSLKHYCYQLMEVQVNNWSPDPVVIQRLQLIEMEERGDTGCSDFSIYDDNEIITKTCDTDADCQAGLICQKVNPTDDNQYCHIPGGGAVPGLFNMRYRPVDTRYDKCTMRIQSTLPGAGEFLPFTTQGTGRPPNECPFARMSLQSHGPVITQPINGIIEDTKLCFYGNVSLDPDNGTLVKFSWTLDRPDNSNAEIQFLDTNHWNVCVTFDYPGDYAINLKVQDDDGCWSETTTSTIAVNGNQGLRAILRFESGSNILSENIVDMDLVVIDSIGGTCSDNNLTSNNTCTFPQGHGTAIMTQYSMGAGCCGTVEEMRIPQPTDGPWTIRAKYVNDCSDWSTLLVVPICWKHEENNSFTIEIWDPNDYYATTPLFPTLHGTLKVGNVKDWLLVRIDGVWQAPVPM